MMALSHTLFSCAPADVKGVIMFGDFFLFLMKSQEEKNGEEVSFRVVAIVERECVCVCACVCVRARAGKGEVGRGGKKEVTMAMTGRERKRKR